MDFYPKNPTTLRRLLTKRQSPCTQIFKTHPSNPTNGPMPAMNLPNNDASTIQEEKLFDFANQKTASPTVPVNNFFHSESESPAQETSSPIGSTASSVEEEEDDDEAADVALDQVQKKVKTSMLTPPNLKSYRRASCEEEKEESDHSTACDARSEINTVNEPADFLLSPSSMCQLPSRELPELRLDDNLSSHKSESSSLTLESTVNASDIKKAQNAARNIAENLAACDFDPESKQKLRCKMNHQWELDLSTVAKKGCPRCEDLLEQCRDFARKNEGSCLNQEYDETIRYRCNKGHCWNLNYKNAKRRWCAQCAKEQRAFLKKKCEEDKVEREKQEEEQQRKLFEEAKRKAAQESKSQKPFNFGSTNSGSSGQKPMSTLEYFQRIDYEIESLAKKYTVEFMSKKEFGGDTNYNQILQVYKIVIMPEQILQSYMFNLSADALKSEYKRMAKIIHPDKNKHPQAEAAFKKIRKVYEVAVSRFEGNQQKI